MILTQDDLELLKQLQAAGERGRTEVEAHPTLLRLLKGGYVADQPAELDQINYRITRRGKDAIATAEWWSRTSIAQRDK